jgi:hypothetical protein
MKRRTTRVPGFKMIDKWEQRGAPGIEEMAAKNGSPKKE